MFHKSIFQGKIEFDNPRSYSKGLKMFRHRVDNYHKSIELIFEEEEMFNEEMMTMEIPRTVINVTEKAWKTTVSLLKYTAQFAISGNIGAWMIEDGNLMHFAWIEPKSDKAVVKNYQEGKKLSKVEGKEKASLYKYALVQKKLGNDKAALDVLKNALKVDQEGQKYVNDGDIYVEMSL